MKTFRGFVGVSAILLFCAFSSPSYGEFVAEEFEEKWVALYKVVDYIHQRPCKMNVDVTLAVTIAQANVGATLSHKNARHLDIKYRHMLETIWHLCDVTRRQLLENIVAENKDVQLLHETINYPTLWTTGISWRNGSLEKGLANPSLTNRDIRDLVMQGTPKEEESDRCLIEIVRNTADKIYKIPEECLKILSSSDPARGYPLNHRLLIILVARAMRQDRGLSPSRSIRSYCSSILQDLIDIEAAGFPYQTPDLMMEEVVLCGMQGFREFTGSRYQRLILDWSYPSGCYSSFGKKYLESHPVRVAKRASRKIDFNCDSHATGLAAAAISLFIRENLENAQGLIK